jgi:hypothetical protein
LGREADIIPVIVSARERKKEDMNDMVKHCEEKWRQGSQEQRSRGRGGGKNSREITIMITG